MAYEGRLSNSHHEFQAIVQTLVAWKYESPVAIGNRPMNMLKCSQEGCRDGGYVGAGDSLAPLATDWADVHRSVRGGLFRS